MKKNQPEGLGLFLNKETNNFLSIGNFKEGTLNGIGREFKDTIINDGIFKNGQIVQNLGKNIIFLVKLIQFFDKKGLFMILKMEIAKL